MLLTFAEHYPWVAAVALTWFVGWQFAYVMLLIAWFPELVRTYEKLPVSDQNSGYPPFRAFMAVSFVAYGLTLVCWWIYLWLCLTNRRNFAAAIR